MQRKLFGFTVVLAALFLLILAHETGYAQGPRSHCVTCSGNLSQGQATYTVNGCQVTVMFSYSLSGCGDKAYVEIDSVAFGSGCGSISNSSYLVQIVHQLLMTNPMGFPNPPAGGACLGVNIGAARCSFPNSDLTYGVHVCNWCCGEYDICVTAGGVRQIRFVNATSLGSCVDEDCSNICPWQP